MFNLSGSKLRLRALEPSDLDKLYLWENDTALWEAGETIVPYSNFQLEQYITADNDIYANKQMRLMIEVLNTKETIGCIDLFDFNPFHQRAGLGILIYSMEHRRKGYASEAIELMKNYSFTALSLHQLYCSVAENNQVSLLCMQKNGFEICGQRKAWYRSANKRLDEYLLQCFCPTSNTRIQDENILSK